MKQAILRNVAPLTLPVLFGYVPMGMAFGVLFVELGYAWYFSTIMAMLIFAGAAQFMAVGLLAAGAGMTEVLVTTLLLNSRHMFYGLSLLQEFKVKGWRRWYLIFGLTDETYSLLTSLKPKDHEIIDPDTQSEKQLYITFLNHGYWIIGCTLGAVLGQAIQIDTQGLDFILTALFMVLVIEQYKTVQQIFPFVIALAAGIVTLMLAAPENMLLISLSLSLVLLLFRYKVQPWN
jgi:4-azaleucine resistance transporter AzlC